MKLSIIIPSLNEERYIGKLLKSLEEQTFKDFEVVVVDGRSKDKTQEVVISFADKLPELTLVVAEKRNIAHQRNLGAEKAGAGKLLFLDADAVLDKDFLKSLLSEAKKRKFDCAACLNRPLDKHLSHRIFYFFYNGIFWLTQFFWPVAPGVNIFVKRDIFQKVGKFDESILVGEDVEFLQRTKKKGFSYRFLLGPKIYVSTRRLHEEGVLGYTKTLLRTAFYFLTHGPITSKDKIDYPLGKHTH